MPNEKGLGFWVDEEVEGVLVESGKGKVGVFDVLAVGVGPLPAGLAPKGGVRYEQGLRNHDLPNRIWGGCVAILDCRATAAEGLGVRDSGGVGA
jgi:hypothetical protein